MLSANRILLKPERNNAGKDAGTLDALTQFVFAHFIQFC